MDHLLSFLNWYVQAMLFMNFSSEGTEPIQSKYREVAEQYKGQGISFLLGDLEASQGAFQVSIYFHLLVCFWFFY